MSGNIRAPNRINKDPDTPGVSKNLRRNIVYFRQMSQATPKWVDHDKICAVYRDSKRQRRQGRSVCVDHIVPLNHPHVCDLHWHGNLQVITEKVNERKSNHYWPGMWHEQFNLFELPEVEQYELHYCY